MLAIADLKRAHRGIWAAGDYAAVAAHIDDAPPSDLLAATGIDPGHSVLDVATGTGNVALRAAAAGATVVGLDLTPELLETARVRAERLGVTVEWVDGDAEQLPFAGESFDRVLSAFGVQFAPRHEVVAGELVRVLRPGGAIGLVNWTPGGVIGRMLRIIGSYMPPPPAYASPPAQWGDEDHVRGLLDGSGLKITFRRGTNPWRFPSPGAWLDFMESSYGPMLKARERLSADGSWTECRDELLALAVGANRARNGSLMLPAEYLVTVARWSYAS
jgi:SAM-dependent methyltransferase